MKFSTTVKTVSAAAMMCLASSAWAVPSTTYTLGGTNVGELDVYVDSTTLSNSGEETERAWVESVLGGTITFSDKTDLSDPASEWQLVDGESDIFAFELLTDPAHYLIKTGRGGMTETHFLFSNSPSSGFAVLDFGNEFFGDLVKRNGSINITKLSHVSEFNAGTTTGVPEPTTIALLGAGLIGMAFTRRRKQKS